MRCLSVCLSVRPSVRHVRVSKRVIIYSIFSVSNSYTILVFPYQTLCEYSDGERLTESWMQGYKNIAILGQYLALSRKWYKIGVGRCLLLNTNRNLHACHLSNCAIYSYLKWPLTRISRSSHYVTLNISEMVRDTDIVAINVKKIFHRSLTFL